MKCPKCNEVYTGYIVKKKNLYYYKCRTKGCCCNKNAQKVNLQFINFIQRYAIKPEYMLPLIDEIITHFEKINETNTEQQRAFKMNLNEVEKKIETIEEKYFVTGEMSKESFEKFQAKYSNEKEQILLSIQNTATTTSNLAEHLKTVITFSSKLTTVWTSSPVKVKENLQKVVFPDGIIYDTKKEEFRTEKVNEVFELIEDSNSISEDDITNQGGLNAALSNLVGRTGQISNNFIKDLRAVTVLFEQIGGL